MPSNTIFDVLNEAQLSQDRPGGLVMRNVMVDGRRTSMRLEPPLWDWLDEVAQAYALTVGELCTHVAKVKPDGTSLTAAMRVLIAAHYRRAEHQARAERVRSSAA